ncbi:MAG: hypothetical protein PVF33_13525 [Candidatus Latescibacterota bacterium]|jgi:hypothetical protein
MSTRERKPEERQINDATPQPATPARERVDSLRNRAEELLATARNVIDRTLSGESEEYLHSVRQQGGQ